MAGAAWANEVAANVGAAAAAVGANSLTDCSVRSATRNGQRSSGSHRDFRRIASTEGAASFSGAVADCCHRPYTRGRVITVLRGATGAPRPGHSREPRAAQADGQTRSFALKTHMIACGHHSVSCVCLALLPASRLLASCFRNCITLKLTYIILIAYASYIIRYSYYVTY